MGLSTHTWQIGSSGEDVLEAGVCVPPRGSSLWILVREGRLAASWPGGTAELEAGDAFFLQQSTGAMVSALEPSRVLRGDLRHLGSSPLDPVMLVRGFCSRQRGVVSLLSACPVDRAMATTRPGVLAAYGELLGSAMLAEHRSAPQEQALASALRDDIAVRAAEAMAAEPGRAWTLAELAALSHVGTTTLVDRFRASTGLAPLQFLRRLRLHRAMDALAGGDRLIATIAQEAGYASTEAFSRAFRAETGQSPARWRQDSRGRAGSAANTSAAASATTAPAPIAASVPH